MSAATGMTLSSAGAFSSGGSPAANSYPPSSGAGATGPGVPPANYTSNAGPTKTIIAVNQGTLTWILGGALLLSIAWHVVR